MSAPVALLERFTEAELVAAYGETLDDAWHRVIEAEITRREAGERAAAGAARPAPRADYRAAGRAEWRDMAHAQFLQAERECRGVLLNRRGTAAGIDPWSLWSGPERRVGIYASEELREFFRSSPRITVTEYQRQAAAGRAEAREAWASEQSLESDERAGIRPGAARRADSASAVSGVRPRGERDSGPDGNPGPARADRDRDRDRDREGDATMSGCRHPHQAGTPRQCRDCPLSTGKAGQTMNAGANFTAAAARAATAPADIPAGPDAAETRRRERLARIERAREVLARREAELNAAAPAAVPARAVAARPGTALAIRAGRGSVDGARVLGYARQLLTRYARFPSAAAADAATLWAAHAHARDKDGTLAWQATPRLMLLSSQPGSGKSRVLELLGWLCPSTFGLDTEPTAAGLAWTLSSEHATGLLDEADVLFGAGKRRESIRAILNSGYRRNGTILRMRGGKGDRQRVFGPVALAGLDVLQTSTGESLAPLFSRAIVIRMRIAAEAVPPLDREGCAAAARIRTALALWTAGVRDEAAQAQPELPAWLMNRPAEIWTPLLAIADAAGGGWPERAREACEELARYSDIAGERDDDDDIMAGLAGITAGWDDDRDY